MFRPILAMFAALALAAPGAVAHASLPSKDELERQKLEQEVRKLRRENTEADTTLDNFLALAPFIALLVGVAGVVVPVLREVRQQRQQRESEALRRLDEQFAKAVLAIGDLGDDKEAVQIGAVVTLENLLQPKYHEYHDQVYRVLCANLTVDHSPMVNRFLSRAFAKAARVRIAASAKHQEQATLDFARCRAERVDLSGLDLKGADFAFGHFRGSNLTGCDLTRALGREAHFEKVRFSRSTLREIRFHQAYCKGAQFHDALMTSAELRGADLRNAEFQRAKLQGAHLDNARLVGARFDQANLADAYFTGAELDDRVLSSMLNAIDESWRKVDPQTRTQLERLAAGRTPVQT